MDYIWDIFGGLVLYGSLKDGIVLRKAHIGRMNPILFDPNV